MEALDLKSIVSRLPELCPSPLTYESLCDWVADVDWSESKWKEHLPEIADPNDYARNILCLEPFEVVLLHWPPGVESAVHHHEGFWGSVICLEGMLENVTYRLKDGVLEVQDVLRAVPGGLVPEPDGTLHKIQNGSESEALVTLHFYSPALANLDGLVLYDLPTGRKFTCNQKAPTASVHLSDDHYHSIEKDAFEFKELSEASHIQCNVVPKPSASDIEQMVLNYFAEHAAQYDELDDQIKKRKQYTDGIDQRIATGLQTLNTTQSVRRVMHLACGTGRRAATIQSKSGLKYRMDGVDLCDDMSDQAEARGLQIQLGSLSDPSKWMVHGEYDAVTLLYAYGHLPDRETREGIIQAAFDMLKPGGRFYFDAFDIDDPNEWGPVALSQYKNQRLEKQGYQAGDVFYRRAKGDHLAFLHYCSVSRLKELMDTAGFRDVQMTTIGYDESSGVEAHDGKIFVAGTKPLA